MPHFQFEPRRELDELTRRMKKFADEFPESFAVEFGRGYNPRVDVVHGGDTVNVYVELPGVKREDVNLKIKENVLFVSGSKPDAELENKTRTLSERTYGEFLREIALPEKVDRESIQAKLEDGVLNVTLKKTIPADPNEIEIEIE